MSSCDWQNQDVSITFPVLATVAVVVKFWWPISLCSGLAAGFPLYFEIGGTFGLIPDFYTLYV